jgi:hypothetical protein
MPSLKVIQIKYFLIYILSYMDEMQLWMKKSNQE